MNEWDHYEVRLQVVHNKAGHRRPIHDERLMAWSTRQGAKDAFGVLRNIRAASGELVGESEGGGR